MADTEQGRPPKPPRLPKARMPRIPVAGTISEDAAAMPDSMSYDAETKRLHIGQGFVENVEPAVWQYEISGKQVLVQWFRYRRLSRERPILGDRRPQSALSNIQPDHWLAEYTTELINVLNVLGRLVELEPLQTELLEEVCNGPTFSVAEVFGTGVLAVPANLKRKTKVSVNLEMF